MKIAVVLTGLCNIRPDYFKYTYRLFDVLGKHHNVHTYMHHWNDINIYPDGIDQSDKIYTHIPIDNKSNHIEIHRLVENKTVIYSDVVDLYKTKAYQDCGVSYVSFVNSTAQFYAFNHVLNSFDFSEYDFIIKWRYDLLSENRYVLKYLLEVLKNIEENTLYCSGEINVSGLNVPGIHDTWFCFSPDILNKFNNFHYDISCIGLNKNIRNTLIKTKQFLNLPALHLKSFPIVEHQLLQFTKYHNINIKNYMLNAVLVRDNTELPNDYISNQAADYQLKVLGNIKSQTPNHIRHTYETQ